MSPTYSNANWEAKKESTLRELRELEEKSPVFRVLGFEDRGDEFLAVTAYLFSTLVVPKHDEIRREGPCVVGMRYKRHYLTTPPPPTEIVSVLEPMQFFHPNCRGGLCVGHPPAGVRIFDIAHLTYAALTLTSWNTRDWETLNPRAADFVRRHLDDLPLLTSGFYELPPDEHFRRLPGEDE